ncbi:outer membrane protein transport protein [Shigella flexneri]
MKIDFKGNYSSDSNRAFNNYGLPIPTATGGATNSGHPTLNLPEMWEVSGDTRVDSDSGPFTIAWLTPAGVSSSS